jgi:hypothetical protein
MKLKIFLNFFDHHNYEITNYEITRLITRDKFLIGTFTRNFEWRASYA